jgi:hypothetical protein
MTAREHGHRTATASPAAVKTVVRAWVYRAAAVLLIALGTLTALTGVRTP